MPSLVETILLPVAFALCLPPHFLVELLASIYVMFFTFYVCVSTGELCTKAEADGAFESLLNETMSSVYAFI
jgi:hypothetical protein